jgi:hypothetical protein
MHQMGVFQQPANGIDKAALLFYELPCMSMLRAGERILRARFLQAGKGGSGACHSA